MIKNRRLTFKREYIYSAWPCKKILRPLGMTFGILLMAGPLMAQSKAIVTASLTTDPSTYFEAPGSQGAILCPRQAINPLWPENSLAPPGCASITKSGGLTDKGINWVVHAATGSMGDFDQSTEPSLISIANSVKAGVLLASKFGVKRLAIPLVGGKIFLGKIDFGDQSKATMEVKAELLALAIIKAVAEVDQKRLEYVFVGYTEDDQAKFERSYEKHLKGQSYLNRLVNQLVDYFEIPFLKSFSRRSVILKGDITDLQDSHVDAIMNAANMELRFGGGLSGAIGRATGIQSQIDDINSDLIEIYYENVRTLALPRY